MNTKSDCLIHLLCSSCITSLHHYYDLVRPSSLHRYSNPNGFCHLVFSLNIKATGSRSSTQEPKSDSRLLYAGCRLPGNQVSCRLIPEDRKLLEQAERNFVNAVLRRESGAAISPEEFVSAEKQYFAQRGDGDAVLAKFSIICYPTS